MPKLAPIKRKDLIYYLRQFEFEGLFSGGKHEFMKRDVLKVRIPNQHPSDISKDLLARILKQAGIEKTDWESL